MAGRVEAAKDIIPAVTGTRGMLGDWGGDTDQDAASDGHDDFPGCLSNTMRICVFNI